MSAAAKLVSESVIKLREEKAKEKAEGDKSGASSANSGSADAKKAGEDAEETYKEAVKGHQWAERSMVDAKGEPQHHYRSKIMVDKIGMVRASLKKKKQFIYLFFFFPALLAIPQLC